MERINESFIEGIKESTEIKMGVAHVACNGVCVCVPFGLQTELACGRKIKKNKDENLIFKKAEALRAKATDKVL